MPPRPYVLAETTWHTVRATDYQVIVLPWGATEAHNFHLPYGTDNLETERIAIDAARLAWERGARPLVLPTIPFGVNTQQLDIPGTINMNPSTQALVLGDVVDSLEAQGFGKLVVLNGHGGNDFRQMIRELQAHADLRLFTLSWYTLVPEKGYFDATGDHAGEMETSVMLHLVPELVAPLEQAGPGRARASRLEAVRAKRAWAPREWTQVTDDTGVGDPRAATAEKGRRYVDALVPLIADFLVELAAADPADLYEP